MLFGFYIRITPSRSNNQRPFQVPSCDGITDNALVEESRRRAAKRFDHWGIISKHQRSPDHDFFQTLEGHEREGR